MEDFKPLLWLVFVLPFLLLPLTWGFDDGYMKKHGTEAHWPKYIIFACIAYFMLNSYSWVVFVSLFGLVWKPAFDIGWSIGAGFNYIYIGETFFMDRWIRKLGLWDLERKKFPVITILYFFMIFIGSMLIFSEI